MIRKLNNFLIKVAFNLCTSNCNFKLPYIYIGLKIFQFQKTTTDKMLCSTLKAGEEMDIIMFEMKRKRKKTEKGWKMNLEIVL